MARARMTYLSEAERQFVHEQTVYVLTDDVVAEIERVIEGYARSVGASQARVRWREPA